MFGDFFGDPRRRLRPPFQPPGPPPTGQFPGQPSGPPPGVGPGTPQRLSPSELPPPPSQVPLQEPGAFRVDPGSIRFCLNRYVYITLNNGQSFWFFPIFVGPSSIAGYRWFGFFWFFFGIDLRNISSFICV